MKALWSLFVLILPASLLAQSFLVEGKIVDDANAPLEMANVIALSVADSNMEAYAFSNAQGEFQLRVKPGQQYILRISFMGFNTLDTVFFADEKTMRFSGTFALQKMSETLQEVNVVEEMPIVISGDTISYKADAFNSGDERKLEDVLKNLPGFEIDEDGQVKVEGKTVEKVMVEGKDFFDGDSKVATKNIPANAVEKVQVLRNYNDISPLGRVTNNEDRIALNIKLKEGKKRMVFGDVEAAAGPDNRYLAHPNIFYYSPKTSVNFIGDANNVGQPAFTLRDYFRFSGGFRALASRSGSNLMMGRDLSIPGVVDGTRNTEFSSLFGAANFNINPNKAWSINGYAMAYGNSIEGRTTALNNYIGQDTLALREESRTLSNDEDKNLLAKVNARYTPNVRTHVAYDALLKYSENSGLSEQSSDFGVASRLNRNINAQEPVSLQQGLEAVYEVNEKSILSLEAQHLYKEQNPFYDLLTDTMPNFALIPLAGMDTFNLQQNQWIKTSKLDVLANYYYVINRTNHIEFSAGGTHSRQLLNSQMAEVTELGTIYFQDSILRNDVDFTLTDVFAGIHYRTKLGKFTIKPGVHIHRYAIFDVQLGQPINREWWFALPEFFAKYDIKKSENIVFNYQMQAAFTDVVQAAQGVILQNYNSLFRGNRMLDNALYHNFNLRYTNFNMFNFTTIFAGANYVNRIQEITNTVNYIGIDRVSTPINAQAANDMVTGFVGYQRRISYYKISAGANINFARTNNFVNGFANTNNSVSQNYRVGFATNFKEAPNVEVSYIVLLSNYSGANVENKFVNHMPKIEVDAVFLEQFLFEASYEYNFYKSSSASGPSSEFDFLEAKLSYLTKNEKWEFNVSGTNLLNTEFIRSDSFSNNISSTQATYVLPRYFLIGAKYML